MYLHQKLGYKWTRITEENVDLLVNAAKNVEYDIVYFDTETTGLDIINDKPFLIILGIDKNVFTFEPTEKLIQITYNIFSKVSFVIAHNCKYDYHMLLNLGYNIPDNINFADSMAIARLTSYADNENLSLSLENLGQTYVDKDSKFAGHIIKKLIMDINRKRKINLIDYVCEKYKVKKPEAKEYIAEAFAHFKYSNSDNIDRINDILDNYKSATYKDVYIEEPELMLNYACDDVVIMREFCLKAFKVLDKVDPNYKTFNREGILLKAVADMERQGFYIDINYMLESRRKLLEYRKRLYNRLHQISGTKISVGQHAVIKQLFIEKFSQMVDNTDIKSLKNIEKLDLGEASEFAKIIHTLRTVDKWLSTYIDGKLNSLINGKLYSTINNQGAVSGRVSSNMQQQPKEALYDQDKLDSLKEKYGEHSKEFAENRKQAELFHPRRAIISPENYIMVFQDFGQMELRVQAYYTLLISGGDVNMCRAYIPFNCISIETFEDYDYKNPEHMKRWNSGEWYLQEDMTKPWIKTDLHTATTFTAFPFLNSDEKHPEFKKYRKLGKMCNFLKNYQGGIGALQEQLDCTLDIAKTLDSAYYTTFPKVKDYQKWVDKQLKMYGFIENLYGRRYYMQDSKFFYKACNYVIQGGCADLVKQKEIEVWEYLKNKKSKLVYPIHDELAIYVHKDELYIIEEINKIITDTTDIIKYIPMVSDIDCTESNWADKISYDKWRNKICGG